MTYISNYYVHLQHFFVMQRRAYVDMYVRVSVHLSVDLSDSTYEAKNFCGKTLIAE